MYAAASDILLSFLRLSLKHELDTQVGDPTWLTICRSGVSNTATGHADEQYRPISRDRPSASDAERRFAKVKVHSSYIGLIEEFDIESAFIPKLVTND